MTSLNSAPQCRAMVATAATARRPVRSVAAMGLVLAASLMLSGCVVFRDIKDWLSRFQIAAARHCDACYAAAARAGAIAEAETGDA